MRQVIIETLYGPVKILHMVKGKDMKCFARWMEEDNGICFRDQTILQFGESWDLIANFILLNPGSAIPLDGVRQNEYLKSKNLLYYVDTGEYFQFTIDRLMSDLLKIYSSRFDDGVIKIYNLFNLKNQDSGSAIEQYKRHRSSKHIHTEPKDIRYGDAPVIIATGDNVHSDPGLEEELRKYISLADPSRLYGLVKQETESSQSKRLDPMIPAS